jgi:hypothetical protein
MKFLSLTVLSPQEAVKVQTAFKLPKSKNKNIQNKIKLKLKIKNFPKRRRHS